MRPQFSKNIFHKPLSFSNSSHTEWAYQHSPWLPCLVLIAFRWHSRLGHFSSNPWLFRWDQNILWWAASPWCRYSVTAVAIGVFRSHVPDSMIIQEKKSAAAKAFYLRHKAAGALDAPARTCILCEFLCAQLASLRTTPRIKFLRRFR